MKKKIAIALTCIMAFSIVGCSGEGESVPHATDTPAEGKETVSATEAVTEADTDVETENTAAEKEVRYHPEWAKDAVIYEVNVRQYTQEGTFNAFSEHLQTLKDMGINTLWFMPIHPISETKRAGTLGSYYSITDYCAVNPEFGTAEDFKALVDKAHDMGFKIMLDWVANHTGWDCAWIDEHPDWYTQNEAGGIISPEGMGWPDVADLNYDNMDMRAEMIECMKYWVQEYDIDGFRCDYATGVPVDFWETARKEVETIKPVFMLAEDNLKEDLLVEAFDMNYNWSLYDSLVEVAKDAKKANVLKYYIPDDYPDGSFTLNFMDNHDKNAYDRTIMEGFGADTLPCMFSFLYTIPGVPLIYSGDEIGLDYAIAFMEKDPIDWGSSDYDYRELLGELSAIRSQNPALYCGNYGGDINYYDVDNKNVFAFYREKDGNIVKCIFNLCKREQTIDLSEIIEGTETVLLHAESADNITMADYAVSEENIDGEVTIQPWEFWILSQEK